MTSPSRSEERPHVVTGDGSDCWCNPYVESYDDQEAPDDQDGDDK